MFQKHDKNKFYSLRSMPPIINKWISSQSHCGWSLSDAQRAANAIWGCKALSGGRHISLKGAACGLLGDSIFSNDSKIQ